MPETDGEMGSNSASSRLQDVRMVPRDRIIVAKIGGSTLGSHDTTLEDIVRLHVDGFFPVIVHGGGKVITEWLARQQIPTKFARGLRVTDQQSLEVVVAVLAGLVNKDLVASIVRLGGRAVGISGVDGRILLARPLDEDLGLVGEVVAVDTAPIELLLAVGYIPVVAPIAISHDGGSATLYNVNADTAAGQLSAALGASRLIFLTDVPGIANAAGQLCKSLTDREAASLIAKGVASGGMIPKIEACLAALQVAEFAQIVDGRVPGALLDAVRGQSPGTVIRKDGSS